MADHHVTLNPPDTGWVALAAALVLAVFAVWRFRHGRTQFHRVLNVLVVASVVALLGVCFIPTISDSLRRVLPVAAIFVMSGAWIIREYGSASGSAGRATRAFLAMVRLAALAAVFAAFLRPMASWSEERRMRPTLLIARDASRSMSIADVPRRDEFEARGRAVRRALSDLAPRLKALGESWDIVQARFSDVLTIDPPAASRPANAADDGMATSISSALSSALTALSDSDRQLGAVVLISDGAENVDGEIGSSAAARNLSAAGVALFAVGVGSPLPMGDTRTIVARTLIAPERASSGTRISIAGDFDCLGFAGEPVEVELLWEGEVVERQTFTPRAAAEPIHAAFDVEARPAGFRSVEVRASPRDGATAKNTASLSRFIQVTDDAMQVLLVESHPRSESGFIARALAGEGRVRLTRMYLSKPPEGEWANPLPASREAWREYQVVLLGEVTRAEAGDSRLNALLQAVEKDGVGLAVLGGFGTPNARSLLVGPLADVLPIRRPDKSDQPGSGHILPTTLSAVHPICVMSGMSPGVWESLPTLPTGLALGRIKPAAQVLLTDEGKRPVLAVQSAGQGRTAAMAIDTTWRWAMQSDEGAELHRRFWRQLAIWLAGKPVRVHVASDRPRYDLAQVRPGTAGIRVDAFVFDGGSEASTSTYNVSVALVQPDGKESAVVMQPAEGRWVGRVFVQSAGTYALRLKAQQTGRPIQEAESRFVVEDIDRELREPLANLELLQSLAAETDSVGGGYVALDQLGGVLDRLKKDPSRQVRVERRHADLTIDYGFAWLGLVVALLMLEWIVRKRAGLV